MRLLVALMVAGSLAAPASASAAGLQFTDWTASTATSATGSLRGHSVTLTGSRIHSAVVDGSSQLFSTPDFTPQLANSDMVEFAGFSDYSYTLNLGAPTQDPVLELYSLGSPLTFPPGTQLVKVSGQRGLTVSANTVGAASDDVNGTVRVAGVFSALTFSTTISYVGPEDGIDLQVGGTAPGTVTPPPPACTVCDSDGDMVTDGLDCDDLNPAIHQGARDVPGNGIDEDCTNADARLPKLDRHVQFFFDRDPARKRARFTTLALKPARAGDTLRLSCRGGGCPLRKRVIAVKHNGRRFVLTRHVAGAWLHRRARLTLRVEHAGRLAKTFRWKIVKAKPVESSGWDRPAG